MYILIDSKEKIEIKLDGLELENLTARKAINKSKKIVEAIRQVSPSTLFILGEDVGGQFFRIKTF